ncbi:MAG: hypothetical protein J4F36_14310 [Nitrosopumilaceae archaeon]|nr:hypothetical protein [Nitrosopumilaceae archaeon]
MDSSFELINIISLAISIITIAGAVVAFFVALRLSSNREIDIEIIYEGIEKILDKQDNILENQIKMSKGEKPFIRTVKPIRSSYRISNKWWEIHKLFRNTVKRFYRISHLEQLQKRKKDESDN